MYKYHFKLDHIVDGDTIDAIIYLGFGLKMKKRIRMVGINCPETRTRDKAGLLEGVNINKLMLTSGHAFPYGEKWEDKV